MLTRVLLLFLIFLSQIPHAETEPTKPRLAHANRYTPNIDITQYLVSEKLDGVRGYWDGQNLYTRNGIKINAPAWFTKNWPDRHLDGELWIARNHFEKVSGIVRRKEPKGEDWRQIRFMLFDIHPALANPEESFESRLSDLHRIVAQAGNPRLQVIPQYQLESSDELRAKLDELVENGAEGLMLHKKRASYRAGRSSDLLKFKPLWDAEAKVIAHISGKGKYAGQLGALLVEGVSESRLQGTQFRIGTGFTDAERVNPPRGGSLVTYQFQGYTKQGLPRFPVYLRGSLGVKK